jgi:hypothetical protein
MIVRDGEGLGEGTANIGGSLITTKQFGNFELTLIENLSWWKQWHYLPRCGGPKIQT